MTTTITQGELNELKSKLDSLEERKKRANSNLYNCGNGLSPREYRELIGQIKDLTSEIENAVIIPQITLNNKFTVKVNDSIFTMIITVNPVKTKNIVNCTFDSAVGKALIGKFKGDIVEVKTQTGNVKYEIIYIDEN